MDPENSKKCPIIKEVLKQILVEEKTLSASKKYVGPTKEFPYYTVNQIFGLFN